MDIHEAEGTVPTLDEDVIGSTSNNTSSSSSSTVLEDRTSSGVAIVDSTFELSSTSTAIHLSSTLNTVYNTIPEEVIDEQNNIILLSGSSLPQDHSHSNSAIDESEGMEGHTIVPTNILEDVIPMIEEKDDDSDEESNETEMQIDEICSSEFKTQEHFKHVYDVIVDKGRSASDQTIIEFSILEQNMIKMDKEIKGAGPVGMINHSPDGVETHQYRRKKWNELSKDQKKKYLKEFPGSDLCSETYKLDILTEALRKKRQFTEEQTLRAARKKGRFDIISSSSTLAIPNHTNA